MDECDAKGQLGGSGTVLTWRAQGSFKVVSHYSVPVGMGLVFSDIPVFQGKPEI